MIAHRQNEEYGVETHPIQRGLASTYDQMLDVGSGCFCCSPQGELSSILASLAVSPEAPKLDVLLIRCATLAAPLLFAQALVAGIDMGNGMCEPVEVANHFELKSIIACVDPRASAALDLSEMLLLTCLR